MKILQLFTKPNIPKSKEYLLQEIRKEIKRVTDLANNHCQFQVMEPVNPSKDKAGQIEKWASILKTSIKEISTKNNSDETMRPPYYNILLKEIGERISDIELALHNRDFQRLQYGSTILNDLFLNLGMSSNSVLLYQLKDLLREKKSPEINAILLIIKKSIAQKVQSMY